MQTDTVPKVGRVKSSLAAIAAGFINNVKMLITFCLTHVSSQHIFWENSSRADAAAAAAAMVGSAPGQPDGIGVRADDWFRDSHAGLRV